jgi:predicted nucleic acid-binding protein
MTLLSFPSDRGISLVADASVVINLNATGRAAEIIRALPNSLVVTDNAFDELKGGRRNGHRDADLLRALIDQGVVQLATMGSRATPIYEALVEGSTARTLDDGEAATIACACEREGFAVIDERKARTICAARFPGLCTATTVDLLFSESVVRAIGNDGHLEAVFLALRKARMRVIPEQLSKVVSLLGEERAALCESLPKMIRVKERAEPGGSG